VLKPYRFVEVEGWTIEEDLGVNLERTGGMFGVAWFKTEGLGGVWQAIVGFVLLFSGGRNRNPRESQSCSGFDGNTGPYGLVRSTPSRRLAL